MLAFSNDYYGFIFRVTQSVELFCTYEESPVALILCAEKSQETIELMQLDHGNIHVGQYMTQMPPKELLEQKLSLAIANARELLEQRKEE